MAKRLDKDVIQRHPHLVVFQTGRNDPMRHVPLARFQQETRDSIRAMQTAGIKVMPMERQWCPHLAEIGNAYRDIVRKLSAETGISVIRRYDIMQDWVRTGRITQRDMISDDNLQSRRDGHAAAGASHQEHLHRPLAAAHGGRLIETTSDGFLFEFASARDAILLGLALQKKVQAEMAAEPDTYSSGMGARLAFALSMAIDFECYLIDEVTAVGDARFQQRCNQAFMERRARSDVIMVSHMVGTIKDIAIAARCSSTGG